MTDFAIVPGDEAAVRPWQLILAVAAPTGGGKTVSALRLANGIREVVGGDIGAIDTENGRMTRHLKNYHVAWYLELRPPYTSTRYLEAARQLVAKGCKTIVIDGLSAEHDGEGGHLEQHEAGVMRMAGPNADYKRREAVNFAAWIAPKSERNKMIQGFLALPVNFVWTFRAKEKIALEKDAEGKTKPRSLGWQPICGDELPFEATVLCVLPPRSEGVTDWKALAVKIDGQHRSAFPADKPLDEEAGRVMARFASEGVKMVSSESSLDPAFQIAEPYALGGRAVLLDYWQKLSKPEKIAFRKHKIELGKIADQADAEKAAKQTAQETAA